jgi:MYXO-CTERM domain-containing protein
MRASRGHLLLAALALWTAPAAAQVRFTELMPNPPGDDNGEYVELQNVGLTTIDLAGYTLNDFSGSAEVQARWAFPSTSTATVLAPGRVLLVAMSAQVFRGNFPSVRPDFELGEVSDDATIPNLIRQPAGSGGAITLGNSSAGDGIILRDPQGGYVDGVEYGTTDRTEIPGPPLGAAINSGVAFSRVALGGSSASDFSAVPAPGPGLGYTAPTGPSISFARVRPFPITFGDRLTVTASVGSTSGVRTVDVFFSIATATTGAAQVDYVDREMQLVGSSTTTVVRYRFSELVEALASGLGFNEPATFHERFVRYFVRAEDTLNAVTTLPSNANPRATNPSYLPGRSLQVLPRAPSPIVDVRAGGDTPRWGGLSARVRGVALSGPDLLNPGRFQLALQDGTAGITVFSATPWAGAPIGAGSVVEVVGTIGSFRGLAQLAGTLDVTVPGERGAVATATVTIQQLLSEFERYESRLVHLEDVDFRDARPERWPSDPDAPGSWNVGVTRSGADVVLRITPAARGLFGAETPRFGFHVTGVVGEFDGIRQIFPRNADDIIAKAEVFPDAGVDDLGEPEDAAVGRPDAPPGRDATVGARDSGVAGPVDTGPTPALPDESDSGCDCSTGRPTSLVEAGLGLLLVAGLRLRRRRA